MVLRPVSRRLFTDIERCIEKDWGSDDYDSMRRDKCSHCILPVSRRVG